jgi:pimeloyl-ACP methyl ester carboxylesterase
MRVMTDDGVGLVVVEAGAGPPLLLVHGFGGAKEDFADHMDALGAHHRVVAFDHRGHGESDAPDDVAAYSLDRLAADVLCVADGLGIGDFTLLGHSMGGMAVRRTVLAHPDRIDALVLMDTCHGPVRGLDPALIDVAAQIALEDGKDVLKPLLDAAGTLDTPAYYRMLEQHTDYERYSQYKWDSLSAVMWAAMAREIARQPDQLDRLVEVSCPTLVIVGDQDAPFLADSERMAVTIPGAELVVVPDAGHSPQFENPTVWFAALSTFLRSLAAGRDTRPAGARSLD